MVTNAISILAAAERKPANTEWISCDCWRAKTSRTMPPLRCFESAVPQRSRTCFTSIYLRQRAKTAAAQGMYGAAKWARGDDGVVSLRGLQRLRAAGEVLPGKGRGAAEGTVREQDATRVAEGLAGEHHHGARHLSAPVPLHSGGGRVWAAENRLRFPQIPDERQSKRAHGVVPACAGV